MENSYPLQPNSKDCFVCGLSNPFGLHLRFFQADPETVKAEITVPENYSGDIMGNLNGRRGRIQGMDTKGGSTVVKAQVPLAEMLSYASDLTSMTQGRGTYAMEYSHYDVVPQGIADKIVAAHKPSAEAEEE